MDTFTVEEKHYMAVSLIEEDEIQEGVYLYRYRDAEDGDIVVEQITEPAEYKRVSRAYEARLQFPADFGSVAHAAQKNEIRGTISVASNISQQDM